MISIAICTHNRSTMLRRCLESLCAIHVPGCEWEVLVINNNCTDSTEEVIKEFDDVLPLKTIYEKKTGLSAARNRALSEAKGDLFVFIDDDVEVHSELLIEYENAARNWPEASFFGGSITPKFIGGRPEWLTDELGRGIFAGICVWRDHISEVNIVKDGWPLPWGANFAVKLPIPGDTIFDETLGVRGKKRLANEELIFFMTLLNYGCQGVYTPNARVFHLTSADRFTPRNIWRYAYGKGIADALCGFAERPPDWQKELWWCNWYVRHAVRQCVRDIFDSFRDEKGKKMVSLYKIAYRYGTIAQWKET